jgi:hypothetical protein
VVQPFEPLTENQGGDQIMIRTVCLSALLLAAAVVGAEALAYDKEGAPPPRTAFSTDQSDLWWNPNESGWGMQLVQQDNTIFATVFIYGSDGRPTWVTATINPVGTLTWSGALFATTGPWFGGPFNPAEVGVRPVGTLTFSAINTALGTVTYSIDGITVTKQVQRQLLKYENYNGSFVTAVNLTQSGCFLTSANGQFSGAMTINISQSTTSMAMTWIFPTGASCVYTGSYRQFGHIGQFDGPYSCSTGEIGSMSFIEMTNRIGMMSGRVSGHSTNNGCQYSGRFTGLDPGRH